MEPRIEKFIRRHRVMGLATVDKQGVWCANLFYVLCEHELLFFSADTTRHIQAAIENSSVAVSIALESRVVARLQGVQIQGELSEAIDPIYRQKFLARFPFAVAWNEKLWRITIRTAKFTDNTLGFGTKLYFPPKS